VGDTLDFLNFAEARAIAKRRLPRGIFEFIDRGTEDERALDANRAAFDRVKIRPYVLRGDATRSMASKTGVNLFGRDYAAPIIVAPTAFAGLACFRGEIELARAAAEFGIPFCAATEAITPVEDIARASAAPVWFHLYLWNREELSFALMAKAWNEGCRTLIVTVDNPVSPKREFNVRNGFDVPFRFSARNIVDVATHPRWAAGVLGRYFLSAGVPTFANYPEPHRRNLLKRGVADPLDVMPGLSWDHMQRIRARWKGGMILKGILRPEDAMQAEAIGADGIVVSNHGGRNLDSAIAPIEVLCDIAGSVGSSMTVLADSSVQRGSDIFKLLASGAKAVLVGRALLYGAAAGRQAGASRMMTILADELARTMDMSGCHTLADITPDMIATSGG
jgi:isopentenyl diphosphate isomerase/L-lactate dehydrogenase-like FMN-dependent dehydrogenase